MRTFSLQSRGGVTLVIVLSMLVLIAILIVSFFSSVTTELSSSQSYASSADTKQLAESAVNLVTAQVVQATRTPGVAWASQPGMIRTFDSTGAAGDFYKLYSSDAMVVPGTSFSAATEAPPPTWSADRAHYVDLNSPVADSSGKMNFPVIDGNGLKSLSNVPLNKPDPGATYLTYDAEDDGTPDVEGFYVEQPPGFDASAGVSPSNNPVPMPVQWLYMLQDGTVLAPAGNGIVADFSSNTIQPSAANPIVGRIAFWADDETCKVNINTAAGHDKLTFPIPLEAGGNPIGIKFGSFWDIPRADTPVEKASTQYGWPRPNNPIPGLAWNQPYQGEFQRYPGHPATVYLSTIFPSFTRADIRTIIPRIGYKNPATGNDDPARNGSDGGVRKLVSGANVVTSDADRIYASIDELVFKPNVTAGKRSDTDPAKVSKDKVEQSKFFLTASSRAPEINLFGQPRVTIWPVHATTDDNHRTSQDKLISFCSTIGGTNEPNNKPYYFTRSDAKSSTADYAGRNRDLYAYLQESTGQRIPGFGGPVKGFEATAKYGADRDQILTEIFDYVRCTNLVDANLAAPKNVFTDHKLEPGSGVVVPIKIGTTKGFGRFATLAEAAIQFYIAEATTDAAGRPLRRMKAVLLLRLFHPMHGYAPVFEDIVEEAHFSGPWSVQVKAGATYGPETSLAFPTTTSVNHISMSGINGEPKGGTGTRPWGANVGLTPQFITEERSADPTNSAKPLKILGWGDSLGRTQYPFCSDPAFAGVDILQNPSFPTHFSFKGGSVTLVLRESISGDTVQTIDLQFPPSTQDWLLPTPAANSQHYSYDTRIAQLYSSWSVIINPNDTVRALEPVGSNAFSAPRAPYGDLRLVALNPSITVGANNGGWFSPHMDYFDGSKRMAHSLRPGEPDNDAKYSGALFGTLVSGTDGYVAGNEPEITLGISDIRTAGFAGDFDNGLARAPDGAYANKPDEGNILTSSLQPYFQGEKHNEGGSTYFSPNRQVSSAVMFGSLPTGVVRERPWQTLLFRPDPDQTHPGSTEPKDHLLLDLFTMPVVEPYAISEPFSTAGKVNLNYQIMPFGTSINRETGVRAALASTWTMAIPNEDSKHYKRLPNPGSPAMVKKNYRYPINADTTLRQFSDRFNAPNNRNFVSASEICEIDLYPADLDTGDSKVTFGEMKSFWDDHKLTGDNTREMPYTHLYPLFTTKSNTFTVHMRVQTLKQVPSGRTSAADWATWNEGRDQVAGEYRGSSIIERYIDPNDPRFINGTIDPDSEPVDSAYKFRVVSVKQFAP